ncbi:hypothetical protein BDD12DRAFT_502013 [Trichophaea hybrida]|nr:hypothetical protein BDD12DRAFT_502013 [Trichophaea hybrida]
MLSCFCEAERRDVRSTVPYRHHLCLQLPTFNPTRPIQTPPSTSAESPYPSPQYFAITPPVHNPFTSGSSPFLYLSPLYSPPSPHTAHIPSQSHTIPTQAQTTPSPP